MAYASSLLLLDSNRGIGGGGRWFYSSSDGTSLVSVSSYISDAAKRGLKVGDQITQYSTTLDAGYSYFVKAVRSSVTTGTADLTSGNLISS